MKSNEAYRREEFEATFQKLERYLFQSSAMPMVMVNTDGIIVKINQAYEDWSGLSAEELVGSYMPDKVKNCRTHLVAKTGIPEIHCIQHVFNETILSTRLPIFDEEGTLVGAWAMVDVNNYQSMLELQRKIEQQKNSISKYQNELRTLTSGKYWFTDILGRSPGITKAKADAAAAAEAQIDVMIRGETGVGKELFAHAIHNSGPRAGGPFISLNCSALSPNLVEAELFGYEGGAFTDADKRGRQGKFEFANGGTLFLDEIGDMPISIQPKLLRAIEAREVTRVGGHKAIPLDLQVIAATNCDLERMVEQGVFRRDLYYRLSAYVVTIPPLRTRREDIPLLAKHFIMQCNQKLVRAVRDIDHATLERFNTYSWPGNVRELQHAIEHAMNILPDDAAIITPEYLPAHITAEPGSAVRAPQMAQTATGSLSGAMQDMEHRTICRVLREHGGNISESARVLQMSRQKLQYRIKRYKINIRELLENPPQ